MSYTTIYNDPYARTKYIEPRVYWDDAFTEEELEKIVSYCETFELNSGTIIGTTSKEETENALIDLKFLGIDNVLALRGDQIKTEAVFVPEPDGHAYAIDLVHQIHGMNSGKYLDEETSDASPTNFCIGVAGYPEK